MSADFTVKKSTSKNQPFAKLIVQDKINGFYTYIREIIMSVYQ